VVAATLMTFVGGFGQFFDAIVKVFEFARQQTPPWAEACIKATRQNGSAVMAAACIGLHALLACRCLRGICLRKDDLRACVRYAYGGVSLSLSLIWVARVSLSAHERWGDYALEVSALISCLATATLWFYSAKRIRMEKSQLPGVTAL